MHAEGVVHRDVKPANVLLEATGTARPRLRLSDFGIAMRLGEPRLTETNLVVGTPGYLAPEQMLGSEPDFPADLFAVGLVALYLLEGAKPDAKALIQYFAAHGTPSAPQGIPEPLWQVVASLLQPDPQARFRTATGARKALASAVELLPEPGPDDELIEIFDQLGPLPPGFGPEGPLKRAPGVVTETGTKTESGTEAGTDTGTGSRAGFGAGTGIGAGAGTGTGTEAGAGVGAGAVGARSGVEASRHRAGDSMTPHPRTDSPAVGTGSGAGVVPLDPRPGTGSVQPLTMSDTGSFHLPPPQATVSSPQPPTPQRRHGQPEAQEQPPAQAQAHAQPPQAPQQPQRRPQAQSDQGPPHGPAHASPYDSTHVLSSPRPHAPQYPAQTPAAALHQRDHRADASTASYTAQDPQVPPSAQEIPQALPQALPHAMPPAAPQAVPRAIRPAGPQRRHRAARPARRSGPPAKVAIPLLLLALACYAVGFWALTRV